MNAQAPEAETSNPLSIVRWFPAATLRRKVDVVQLVCGEEDEQQTQQAVIVNVAFVRALLQFCAAAIRGISDRAKNIIKFEQLV